MVEQRELFQIQAGAPQRLRVRSLIGSVAQLRMIFLLRLSLALIFFWFGLLKLAGVSPVVDLLHNSIPFLARSPYIELLGVAEIVIAVGLVIERMEPVAVTDAMAQLGPPQPDRGSRAACESGRRTDDPSPFLHAEHSDHRAYSFLRSGVSSSDTGWRISCEELCIDNGWVGRHLFTRAVTRDIISAISDAESGPRT